MKNIRVFLSENFHFLVVKFSVYLNRHVFVMTGVYRDIHYFFISLLKNKDCGYSQELPTRYF